MGTFSKDQAKDGKEGKDGSKDGSKDNSVDDLPHLQEVHQPLEGDLFNAYQQSYRHPLSVFKF